MDRTSRRTVLRWVLTSVAVIAALAVTIVVLSNNELQRAASLSSVVSMFVGVTGLLLTVGLSFFRKPSDSQDSGNQVGLIERLRRAAQLRIGHEIERIGIDLIETMPLQWISTPPEFEDVPAHIDSDLSLGIAKLTQALKPSVVASLLEASGQPRLILLGEAGAGKTTVAIQTAHALIENTGEDDLLPIFFPLSSWIASKETLLESVARQSFLEWSAEPFVREELLDLLQRGRAILVLDGLDELPKELRLKALEALSSDLLQCPLLVTSRPSEYKAAVLETNPIRGAKVLEIRSPSLADVSEYLRRSARRIRRTNRRDGVETVWDFTLNQLAEKGENQRTKTLATVLRIPLYAWLAREKYQQPATDPSELLDNSRFSTTQELKHFLIDDLINARYRISRVDESWVVNVQRWLTHIASQIHLDFPPSDFVDQFSNSVSYRWRRLIPAFAVFIMAFALIIAQRYPVWDAVVISSLAGVATRSLGVLLESVRTYVDTGANTPDAALRKHRTEALITSFSGAIGVVLLINVIAGFREHHGTTATLGAVLAASIGFILLCDSDAEFLKSITAFLSCLIASGTVLLLDAGHWVWAMATIALSISAIVFIGASLIEARPMAVRLLRGVFFGAIWGVLAGIAATTAYLASLFLPESFLGAVIGAALACISIAICLYILDDSVPVVRLMLSLLLLLGIIEIAPLPLQLQTIPIVFFVAASGFSPWGEYSVSRLGAAFVGQLPWRLMRFLNDAVKRGILRTDGAIYRFRHLELQGRLQARASAVPPSWSKQRKEARKAEREKEKELAEAANLARKVFDWRPRQISDEDLDEAIEQVRMLIHHDGANQIRISAEALPALRKLAKAGEFPAMVMLGVTLVQLANEDPDEGAPRRGLKSRIYWNRALRMREVQADEASMWLKRAMRIGETSHPLYRHAMFTLGVHLVDQGAHTEAEQLLKPWIREGSPIALFCLAEIREDAGQKAEAQQILERLADSGEVAAMVKLAFNADRCGNHVEAESWLQMAADAGDEYAPIALGRRLLKAGDSRRAEAMWTDAAAKGNVRAMLELSKLYCARKNADRAWHWYEEAKRQGVDDAGTYLLLRDLQEKGFR